MGGVGLGCGGSPNPSAPAAGAKGGVGAARLADGRSALIDRASQTDQLSLFEVSMVIVCGAGCSTGRTARRCAPARSICTRGPRCSP